MKEEKGERGKKRREELTPSPNKNPGYGPARFNR